MFEGIFTENRRKAPLIRTLLPRGNFTSRVRGEIFDRVALRAHLRFGVKNLPCCRSRGSRLSASWWPNLEPSLEPLEHCDNYAFRDLQRGPLIGPQLFPESCADPTFPSWDPCLVIHSNLTGIYGKFEDILRRVLAEYKTAKKRRYSCPRDLAFSIAIKWMPNFGHIP